MNCIMQSIPDGMELLKIGEQEELTQHYNNVKLDLCILPWYFWHFKKNCNVSDCISQMTLSSLTRIKMFKPQAICL